MLAQLKTPIRPRRFFAIGFIAKFDRQEVVVRDNELCHLVGPKTCSRVEFTMGNFKLSTE